MSNNVQADSGGMGFFGLLAIVFIALKLTDYIDWSWWWVLAPIWIPLLFVMTLLLIAIALAVLDRMLP